MKKRYLVTLTTEERNEWQAMLASGKAAARHEGHISDDNGAPHFVCQVMGETILDIMRERPVVS